MGIGGTGSQENGVGMPCDGKNSGTQWLLDVLRDPPIVFLFKIANGNCASTRANGEFRSVGRPADEGGSSVETEEDKGRFPGSVRRGLPDEGVTVCIEKLYLSVGASGTSCRGGKWLRLTLGTGDNPAGNSRNVH